MAGWDPSLKPQPSRAKRDAEQSEVRDSKLQGTLDPTPSNKTLTPLHHIRASPKERRHQLPHGFVKPRWKT
jgi:hypothetical protein